ncbi:MAG: heme lyase subunit NrfE [Methanomassiliicoccales archaeon PtaU1.Bin124]|nr:MAG: heme lyase subunit NrfE [Methanomassiliicoccales archaeon PtaU1.Bin124]
MTSIGEFAIGAVTLLALLMVIIDLIVLRTGSARMRYWSPWIWSLTLIVLVLTFLYLIFLFLTNDVSFLYVWSRSSSDLDAFYKLGSAYSGAGGSTLFTTILIALFAWYYIRSERRVSGHARTVDLVSFSVSLVIFGLAIILLLSNIFVPTDASRLVQFPNGFGLTPSLQTWEMVVHPPVVFLGYAACIVPFAGAAANLVTGRRETKNILPYARMAWLMITLGIGIGAWWSYYEVGWGGYWGWDPVETASLILWVFLTFYLHSARSDSGPGNESIGHQMIGMSLFIAVLFTIFVTRSGKVWLFAVHTYSASTPGDAGSRLISVLSGSQSVLVLFMMLLIAIIAMIVLAWWAKRYEMAKGRMMEPVPALATGMFLVCLIVLLLLLLKNTDASTTSNYLELTSKVPLVFAALSFALIVCMSYSRFGWKRTRTIILIIALAAVAGSIIGYVSGWDPFLTAAILIAIIGLVMGLMRLVASLTKVKRIRWRAVGSSVIHIGSMLVLIAYIVSTSFQSTPAAGDRTSINIGDTVHVDDYAISVQSLEKGSYVPTPSHSYNLVLTAHLTIAKGGTLLGDGSVITNYYYDDGNGTVTKVNGEVLVLNGVTEDLYLEFDQGASSDIVLSAKTVPMMNLLWAGAILLGLGGIMVIPYQKDERSKA